MDYRLLFSDTWKIVSKSKLIWLINWFYVGGISATSFISNNLIKDFLILIIFALFGICLNFVIYNLALDKKISYQDFGKIVKSLFASFTIICFISFLIFFTILFIGIIFYIAIYVVLFGVDVKLIPSSNFFILTWFVFFGVYLVVSFPTAYSVLNTLKDQSGVFVSYGRVLRTIAGNIGHILLLDFMFASVLCAYVFMLFVVYYRFRVDQVIGISLQDALPLLKLPINKVFITFYSFVFLPFLSTIISLSYLNIRKVFEAGRH